VTQPAAAVVFDNEAVQALYDPHHPKHRTVLAYVEAGNQRRRKSGSEPRMLLPVAVRIEAGWDRTQPVAATINRILPRTSDVDLRTTAADRAAHLMSATGTSPVDATVAQVAESAPQPAAILTSDVDDMTRLNAELAHEVRIIGI
jgi:hypothetical protein